MAKAGSTRWPATEAPPAASPCGVALLRRGVQRLQLFGGELGQVQIGAALQPAADVVGGENPVVGQDRPGDAPGALGKVVKAEAEQAARGGHGHRLDLQIAGGAPAELVQLSHGAILPADA